MRTITIKMHLSIGYAGAEHEDEQEIEVEDDATDKEIEKEVGELVEEWAQNYIDLGYSWTEKPEGK